MQEKLQGKAKLTRRLDIKLYWLINNAMIDLHFKVSPHALCRPAWGIGLIGSLTRLMISLVHNEAGPQRSAISQYPVSTPPVFVSLIC